MSPRKTDPNYDTTHERDMDREPPQFTPQQPLREYLGDGLYVDWDGHQIRLHTMRDEGEHEVFLEPVVLQTFLNWLVINKIVSKR